MLNCLRQQAVELEMSNSIMQSSTILYNIYLGPNATRPNPDPTQPNQWGWPQLVDNSEMYPTVHVNIVILQWFCPADLVLL